VVVKQGKLGYFIGHQHHVQSAEPGDKEVVVKPGGLHTALGHRAQQTSCTCNSPDNTRQAAMISGRGCWTRLRWF
jgi:hypothetical protein